MKLSNILAIAGGVIGLANSDSFASALSSGAAVVAGVAGATGHSDLAKIAGITALGAGAYSFFGGSDTVEKTSSTVDAATPSSNIGDILAPDRNPGGPSGTGQSFSDAKYEATRGENAVGNSFSDARYDAGLDRASGTPPIAATTTSPTNPLDKLSTPQPIVSPQPASATPSLLDQAKSGLSGVGNFLDKNKEIVKLASGALDGAFGTGAQQISLLKARLAQQQQQIDRANTNSNNLVGLKIPVTANPYPNLRPLGT